MRAPGPQNPYEVYCYRCNVTAPVGTRRCLHCGGPLSREEPSPRRAALAALVGADIDQTEEVVEETDPSVGSVLPKIAVWVLLLIGGFLYRFCNG